MVGTDVKKRGIWGNRGLPAGSEHNQGAREDAKLMLQRRMDDLFLLLREIEEAIDQAGEVLRVSQPARMVGKYGLRWWKLTGNARYREPVVVRWMMQKNGVMTPRPAKILKARENGSFAINARETQECLDILAGLIKRRAGLKGRIDSLEKIQRNLGGVSYYLNNERERLEMLKAGAISNLLENGYEVEPSLLPAIPALPAVTDNRPCRPGRPGT